MNATKYHCVYFNRMDNNMAVRARQMSQSSRWHRCHWSRSRKGRINTYTYTQHWPKIIYGHGHVYLFSRTFKIMVEF